MIRLTLVLSMLCIACISCGQSDYAGGQRLPVYTKASDERDLAVFCYAVFETIVDGHRKGGGDSADPELYDIFANISRNALRYAIADYGSEIKKEEELSEIGLKIDLRAMKYSQMAKMEVRDDPKKIVEWYNACSKFE